MENENILLLLNPEHRNGARLQKIVEGVAVNKNIIVVRSAKNLVRILRNPQHGVAATVIFESTESELRDLLPFRDLLLRTHVIVILPDHESQTIAQGHALRPRYVGYADSDFSDVRDVLHKMMGNSPSMLH
ncbi:MAG: hypothetical protein ACOZF0_11540 [Thermodesulfobacteriota bacterium]